MKKNKKYNNKFYDMYADKFETIPFADFLAQLIEKYLGDIEGKQVLDIGSGPGTLAKFMLDKGFSALCIDPSLEMIKRCQEKGLNTYHGSIEEFNSDKQFDIIFAISSLIHLKKVELQKQLDKIASMLNLKGIFFLSIIKGSSEGFEDPTNLGQQRFFSSLSYKEALVILSPKFEILEVHEKIVSKMNKIFLIYVLRKGADIVK